MQQQTDHCDVLVLGGGAAGLMCALTAAQRGRRVVVLEKANRVGKKILMSGGGRCNFTNLVVTADNYICSNPHFCKSALSQYTQWDFIAMVERHGIEYEERAHSQLFCVHSAKDILGMLLRECDSAGVMIRTQCDVGPVTPLLHGESTGGGPAGNGPHRYRVALREAGRPLAIDCESLVVATGALSIPTLGGSGQGYEIARQFGLPLTPRQAGLVPFMFSDATKALCERLAGISLQVDASCNGQTFRENILFTHRGVSGPAILQISNYWQPGDALGIDLLPGLDAGDWLVQAKREDGKLRLPTLLGRRLPRALVAELQALWWADMGESRLADCSDRQLVAIGGKLNHWSLKPSATEGYRTAEVTRGGVDTAGISSRTMEARQHPGLYFIGEVLDVTGHLGGFNFQWAWSSGYCAGAFA